MGNLGNREGNSRGERTRKALLEAAGTVFAGVQYGDARLVDISAAAGVNAGLIHFHFGNKEDIAIELLTEYRNRIDAVLSNSMGGVSAGERILRAFKDLARVIANDPILQAGVTISLLPPAALAEVSQSFTNGWREHVTRMVDEGIEDGSIHPRADVGALASFLYDLFVGAQIVTGSTDRWASFPEEVDRFVPLVRSQLENPAWQIMNRQ